MSSTQPYYKESMASRSLDNPSWRTNFTPPNKNDVLQYPSKSQKNMMMIYFNSLTELKNDDIESYDFIYSDKKIEIPNKNKSYQTMQQEEYAKRVPAPKSQAFFKKYYRTGSGIWMMLPQALRFGTEANWQAIDGDLNGLGLLSKAWLGSTGLGDTALKALSMAGAEVAANVIDAGVEGEMGNALMNAVQNTWSEMSFSGMNRRSFQFTWQLTPKSQEELQSIYNIITTLRFYAHPSYTNVGVDSGLGNYLQFPGTIDIEWYTQDDEDQYIENAWIHKISTCVINSIETDLTSNNQVSVFKNSGAPTTFNLTVQFTETTPLLKQDIARGF